MPQLPQIDSLKAPDRAVAQATRTRRFPWLNLPFVVVVALIVCYGLVVVMSAVANDPDYSFSRQLAGVAAGHRFGARYERPSAIAGGVVLILIGLKILLEHLGVIAF